MQFVLYICKGLHTKQGSFEGEIPFWWDKRLYAWQLQFAIKSPHGADFPSARDKQLVLMSYQALSVYLLVTTYQFPAKQPVTSYLPASNNYLLFDQHVTSWSVALYLPSKQLVRVTYRQVSALVRSYQIIHTLAPKHRALERYIMAGPGNF